MSIFVSYRREETGDITGRICDRLKGQGLKVFLDVDNIPAGINFRQYLNKQVQQASVVLVVIGPEWLSPRLRTADDFVRIEIEAALHAGVPIIPVLVRGAKIPQADALPVSIRALTQYQAARVDSHRDFHRHASDLISDIEQLQGKGFTDEPTESFADEPTQFLDESDIEPDDGGSSVPVPATPYHELDDDGPTKMYFADPAPADPLPRPIVAPDLGLRDASPIVDSLRPIAPAHPYAELRPGSSRARFLVVIPVLILSAALLPAGLIALTRLKQVWTPAPSSASSPPTRAVAPQPARLHVLSVPSGAAVTLDEKPVGRTPIELQDLKPGLHDVGIKADGHTYYVRQVSLQPGQLLTVGPVELALERDMEISAVEPVPQAVASAKQSTGAPQARPSPRPKPPSAQPEQTFVSSDGILNIDARPSGQVFLDGRFVGNTPLINAPIRPGTHMVKVINPDLKISNRFSMRIRSGEVFTKLVDFETDQWRR